VSSKLNLIVSYYMLTAFSLIPSGNYNKRYISKHVCSGYNFMLESLSGSITSSVKQWSLFHCWCSWGLTAGSPSVAGYSFRASPFPLRGWMVKVVRGSR
jgi:hypothetical protein